MHLRQFVIAAAAAVFLAGCSGDPVAPEKGDEAAAWRWVNPQVGGGMLFEDVWAESADRAVAVGANGAIMLYENGTCRRVASGTGLHLRAVRLLAPGDYVAVGDAGAVLRGDGADWEVVAGPGADVTLLDVWAADPDTIYAAGFLVETIVVGDQEISRPRAAAMVAAGGTWTSLDPQFVSGSFTSVVGTGDGSLHFGYSTTTAYRYEAGAWTEYSMGANADGFGTGVYDLWSGADGRVFAVGNAGQVRSFDGQAWSSQNIDDRSSLYGVWAPDHGDLWVAGVLGRGLAARHDGAGWQRESGLSAVALRAIHGVDTDVLFAVGSDGLFLRRTAGGWAPVNGVAANDLGSMWGASDKDVYVGGADGLFHYDGTGLTPVECGMASVNGVVGTGPDDIFVAGVSSTAVPSGVAHFDGTSWQAQVLPDSYASYASAVAADSLGGVLASVGNRIFRLVDGTWQVDFASAEAIWWDALRVFPDGRAVAMGSRRWVAEYDGTDWQLRESSSDDLLTAMWASDADHVFVGTSGGSILSNGGGAWTHVAQLSVHRIDAIWGRGRSDVTAAGGKRLLDFDGETWSEKSGQPPVVLHAARYQQDGRLLGAGFGGAVILGRP